MLAFFDTLLHNLWTLLKSISCWLILSFLISGLLHIILRPEILQKNLGNKKLSSLLKATISGVLLPICSCGIAPLGLSLYYSGAYLGNVLAFMTATPVINPTAVLVAWATLGERLTLIYIATGIVIALIVGTIANNFSKEELAYSNLGVTIETVTKNVRLPLWERIFAGLKWSAEFLGKKSCKYAVPGIVLAALLLTVVPTSFIQRYLSSPNMLSILGIVALSAVMYVCSVGHIPFIAALLGAGASPGIAVTFLIAGSATNLPGLISIYNLIGKRAAVIYCATLTVLSIIAGYLTNLFLPNYIPVFDISINQGKLEMAGKLSIQFPTWAQLICAALTVALFLWNYYPALAVWAGDRLGGRKSHEEV
mgnify:CR=1 FL=1